jgi:adenosylcobinamide-GDP ribazoletransferase
MQDPRSGPVAITVIVLMLGLKFAALQTLLNLGSLALLLIPPLIGRTALIALLLTTPYVRTEGIGAQLVRELPKKSAWAVIALTTAAIILWLEVSGLLLLLLSAATFLLLRYLMINRIDGATGDCAGALLEIMEAMVLLSLALFPIQ